MTSERPVRRVTVLEHLWTGRLRGTVEPTRTVDQLVDAVEPELPLEPL